MVNSNRVGRNAAGRYRRWLSTALLGAVLASATGYLWHLSRHAARQAGRDNALLAAAARNDVAAATASLEAGAYVNARESWMPRSRKERDAMLFWVRRWGVSGVVKPTPLGIAVHRQDTAMAELLLARGADVNAVAQGNATPLLVAAKSCPEKRTEFKG